MLARLRARLTYANVVATLALFIALGGSSYAALKLTGRDIKNRSIAGVDVRRNTLTGKEIREARLGIVPRARKATRANSALLAANATNAGQADVAKNATNAGALGGQAATAFEKSSRTQFARGSAAPAGVSGEQTLLSWPEMGVELTTATGSCAGGNARLAVKNTKASGPSADVIGVSGTSPVAPNGKEYFCGSNTTGLSAQISDSTGRVLFANCVVGSGELRCIGVRSEP